MIEEWMVKTKIVGMKQNKQKEENMTLHQLLFSNVCLLACFIYDRVL